MTIPHTTGNTVENNSNSSADSITHGPQCSEVHVQYSGRNKVSCDLMTWVEVLYVREEDSDGMTEVLQSEQYLLKKKHRPQDLIPHKTIKPYQTNVFQDYP